MIAMVVKFRLYKDHAGYKSGQLVPMLQDYAMRFQRQGIGSIESGSADHLWMVPELPDPEDEEIKDDGINVLQESADALTESANELKEAARSILGIFNNKK
jgi:hypothetical protein